MTELHLTKMNVCIIPFFCYILYTLGSPKSTTDDYYFGNVTIILVVIVGIISVLLGLLVIYAVLKWKKSRSGTVSNNKPDGESIALTSSVIADGHDNNELQMHVL